MVKEHRLGKYSNTRNIKYHKLPKKDKTVQQVEP